MRASEPVVQSPAPRIEVTRLEYPKARKSDVVDDYNGVKVADPYRWLEELDSPETKAWIESEAKLTGDYLKHISARTELKQRLTQLQDYEKYGLPFRGGGRYFYNYNRGLQDQSPLYMTEGLSGSPVPVVDPNLLSSNGTLAVVGNVASDDGKYLAYGVSQGGSDWTDWRIRDVVTGKDLADQLRWTKYYRPIFTPDSKGLFYSSFPSPRPGDELGARDLDDAIYFHALGTPSDADQKVHHRPDHRDWQFEPHLTSDGRWLVLLVGEGEVGDKGLENIYLIDLKTKTAPPLL